MNEGASVVDEGGRVPIRDENWAARKIDGETVLIPIRAGAADLQFIFVLNPTATLIWEQIDGARSCEDLATSLVETFEVSRERARADVRALIASFDEARLIHPPMPNPPAAPDPARETPS